MPTPMTRSFRQGVPTGRNGEQQPVRSNFPSGLGMNRQYEPKTGTGYGTGQGYGTGATPSAPQGVAGVSDVSPTPFASATARVAPAVTRGQMAERSARMARAGTPNAGGTISTSVAPGITATQRFAPSPAANTAPGRPNLGGTMTRGGVTTAVPGGPAALATPVASPTTDNAQQTESADPLTGDGNAQAGGTTDAINPASALGLNRRGVTVPGGDDAEDSSGATGGSGLYARKFSSQKSAGVYADYVKKLFPGPV